MSTTFENMNVTNVNLIKTESIINASTQVTIDKNYSYVIFSLTVGAITTPTISISNDRKLVIDEKNQQSSHGVQVTHLSKVWKSCKKGDVISFTPNTVGSYDIYGIE